ncbi:hypothetical protein ACL58G_19630 [Massilia sp. GER05]|uniref:hypothetical protein n=1 Tax=Massilia sp. GER05 TaxID=3394605 RepID=UPI003F858B8E
MPLSIVALPSMRASDESSVNVPAVTSPCFTVTEEPSCSDVLAVILPSTVEPDASRLTTGAVMLPLTVLPEASVNEFVATMSPFRATGELVVIVAPLIGPLIVACEATLTVPVALMLPVMVRSDPVPRFAVTAWMVAVSVLVLRAHAEHVARDQRAATDVEVAGLDPADVEVASTRQDSGPAHRQRVVVSERDVRRKIYPVAARNGHIVVPVAQRKARARVRIPGQRTPADVSTIELIGLRVRVAACRGQHQGKQQVIKAAQEHGWPIISWRTKYFVKSIAHEDCAPHTRHRLVLEPETGPPEAFLEDRARASFAGLVDATRK